MSPTHATEATTRNQGPSLRWGAGLIAAAGALSIASGASTLYRSIADPGFEPGVGTLGGVSSHELAQTNPEVLEYITHLHVNFAGLAIAMGLAVVALAWYGIREGQRWAWTTALVLPTVFLAHSVPVHLTAGFSFHTLVHLGPLLVVVALLAAGGLLAHRGLASQGGRP